MRDLVRSSIVVALILSLAPRAARAQAMVEVPNVPGTRPPQALPAPAPAPPPPADPNAEFEHHYIGFEDWVAINAHTGVVVNTWSKPIEGKYRRPMGYAEFYERVGRPDLADRYRTRRNLKIGLAVGGGLALVGGFAAMMGQFAVNRNAFEDCIHASRFGEGCDSVEGNGGFIAGGVLMGAGFIGLFTGIVLRSQPAQPYEAREMADHYNEKLRHDLGLDRPKSAPAPAVETTFTLAPSVDAHGAGLRLVARF